MDNSVRIGCPSAHPSAFASEVLAGSLRSLLKRWPLLVAGLAMVALLLSLAAVVRQAVQQAQARHASTAARADANFRCNTMASSAQRTDCRSRANGLLSDAVATNP
jgi:Na+-transporting methylmalonyl-CoA/oxaloacetate decarboxylase gamma subunit